MGLSYITWFFGFQGPPPPPLQFKLSGIFILWIGGMRFPFRLSWKNSFLYTSKRILFSLKFIHWNLPSCSQFLTPYPQYFSGGSFIGVCTRLYCAFTVWYGYMAMLYIVRIHWLLRVFFFTPGEGNPSWCIDRQNG